MNGAARGLVRCVWAEMPVVLTVEEMSRWPCGSWTVSDLARRASRFGAGRDNVGERRTVEACQVRIGGRRIWMAAYRVFRRGLVDGQQQEM